MNKEIKKILKDLYKLDKNLKNYEADLIEIIQKLIASHPQANFNNEFKEKLKAEIMARIEEIKSIQPQEKPVFSLMNKFSYGVIGGLVVIILAVPIIYLNKNNPTDISNTSDVIESLGFNSDISLKQLAGNAFGKIVSSQDQATSGGIATRSQSGGGSGLPNVGFGGGGGMGMMIAPEPYHYKFSYVGDDFTIDESEMDVFKRSTSDNIQTKLAKTIKGMNLGFIDISSLSNAKVRNFNIVEDKEGGYSVAVGLNEETASINIEYGQPMVTTDSVLEKNNIPSDNEIIKKSDDLLKRFGLNLKNYGQPVVDHSWEIYYKQNPSEDSSRYIPDIIQVSYPIMINNMQVYDEGGNTSGPQVSVNIRYNQANGAWGISSNNYQSSKYTIEQDVKKIIQTALGGGYRRYYNSQSNGEVVNIELETPKFSLVAINNFKGETYEQLFVPALVFPVSDSVNRTKFYQKNIVVPLVKDLLDQDINDRLPIPLPVDLIK